MIDLIDKRLLPLLDWCLPEVRAVLGEKLQAVWLGGSAVLGDFQQEWSDVDVCVILNQAITEVEGQAIGQVHDAMRDRFITERHGGWTAGIAEGAYITRDMAADEQRSGVCYVAGGTTRRWGEGRPVSAFDRLIFAQHGQPLFGTERRLSLPTEESLRLQTQADIESILNPPPPALESALWFVDAMACLARTIVYWRDGEVLSKSAAMEREISADSSLARHLTLPLSCRKAGKDAARLQLKVLKDNYLAAMEPVRRVFTEMALY